VDFLAAESVDRRKSVERCLLPFGSLIACITPGRREGMVKDGDGGDVLPSCLLPNA